MVWTVLIGIGIELGGQTRWEEPIFYTPALTDPQDAADRAAERALVFIEHRATSEQTPSLLYSRPFKVAFTVRIHDTGGEVDVVLGTVEKQMDSLGLAVMVARKAAHEAKVALREPMQRYMVARALRWGMLPPRARSKTIGQ